MNLVSSEIQIRDITRNEKENLIKKYFNLFDQKPNFSNFSFSSKRKLHEQQLKYVGAFVFLKVVSSEGKAKSNDVKDRTYFFVFLEGNDKYFDKKEYSNELYDICSYFSKLSQIRIVFDFGNESPKTYRYSVTKGLIADSESNQKRHSGVNDNYDFVRNPEDYISSAIDHQKYLADCYKAFIGSQEGGLNFVETDFYNTKSYFTKIVEALELKKKVIMVNGPAGSGKTILAFRILGMFKNSNMLVFNEYFHAELVKEFSKNNVDELDMNRFFHHRGSNSTEIVEGMIRTNEAKIPFGLFLNNYSSFIWNKHWVKKKKTGFPGKTFWDEFKNPNTNQFKKDFEEFVKSCKLQNVEPCRYLILDEGQRVYQETIDVAVREGLTLILLGDMNQKLNPETDNLKVKSDFEQNRVDVIELLAQSGLSESEITEINLKYPVRISSNALEKICNVLGVHSLKEYYGESEHYPITLHNNVVSFVNAYKRNRESRKFYCSYQDIWRHENSSSESVLRKVRDVKILDKVVMFEFEDGVKAFEAKNKAFKISNELNRKIIDMRGMVFPVIRHELKPDRYSIVTSQTDEKGGNDYYGESSLIKHDPTIRSISKNDRKQSKDRLLIDPSFSGRMFTPYELISRECRSIFLFLPSTITLEHTNSGTVIVETGHNGRKYFDQSTKTNYLLNQLYVLMTRAVRSIDIYVEDIVLREFFAQNLERYEKGPTIFDK